MSSFVLTKYFIEELVAAIDNREQGFIKEVFEHLRPEDISNILDEVDTAGCIYVMSLLDKKVAAEILSDLEDDTRTKFLENFKSREIAQWINFIDSDDAADILNEISLRKREKTLAHIEPEKARNILELLDYEEDCAGGLMAKELIKAKAEWTVVQAIDEIRRQAEKVEKIYSLYVVDEDNRLLGRIALKRIILSSDDTLIGDIHSKKIISVKTYQDEEEVAEVMQKYDLDAVPVVNARNELVGRITIDDIVDVITEKAEQDRQIMSGISEDIEEDDTVWKLTRARLPWLIVGMAGGLLGAKFIGFFEADLAMVPAMAFFIPLITATGGNVGIQSSSIILQSLASQSLMQGNYAKRLLKVLIVAVINGLVIALVVFGFTFILSIEFKLTIIVSIALFFVVLLASVMGTITPLILDRLSINPAVASGPFITTANDLLGLAVYFSIANFLYGMS